MGAVAEAMTVAGSPNALFQELSCGQHCLEYTFLADAHLNMGAGFHPTSIEEVCSGKCCCCIIGIEADDIGFSFEVSKPADIGGVIGCAWYDS